MPKNNDFFPLRSVELAIVLPQINAKVMEIPDVQNPFTLIIDKLIKIESQLSEIQGKADPEILDLDQASELTGFSKSYMYKLTSSKATSSSIPFYKSGKRLLFRRSELISYLLKNPNQQQQKGIVIEK